MAYKKIGIIVLLCLIVATALVVIVNNSNQKMVDFTSLLKTGDGVMVFDGTQYYFSTTKQNEVSVPVIPDLKEGEVQVNLVCKISKTHETCWETTNGTMVVNHDVTETK